MLLVQVNVISIIKMIIIIIIIVIVILIILTMVLIIILTNFFFLLFSFFFFENRYASGGTPCKCHRRFASLDTLDNIVSFCIGALACVCVCICMYVHTRGSRSFSIPATRHQR